MGDLVLNSIVTVKPPYIIRCHKWLNAGEEDKNRMKSCEGPCPKQICYMVCLYSGELNVMGLHYIA